MSKFYSMLSVALLISIQLGCSLAASRCYLPSGSAFVPDMLLNIPVTGGSCQSSCQLDGANWKTLVTAVSKDFTKAVVQNDASCPRPANGFGIPFDGTRRIGRMVSSPNGFTFQFFITTLIPQLCQAACVSKKTRLFIPSYTWRWGGAGEPGMIVICHDGYNAATNTCTKKNFLSFIENVESYFSSICDCFSNGQCS